jgi:hypothetical protein
MKRKVVFIKTAAKKQKKDRNIKVPITIEGVKTLCEC